MTLTSDQDQSDGPPSDGSPKISSRLYPEAFPPFTRLLQASQDYAKYSGCRFNSASFDDFGLADNDGGDPASIKPRLAAKRQAAPVVREFTERLQSGEAALIGEMERAFRLLMAESVRSAMVATCRRLDLWPPASPEERENEEEDEEGRKRDASLEEIPAIAQRLFDEERERQAGDTLGVCSSGPAVELRTARTAAFLVDFAHEAGVPRPEMPAAEANRLQEFMDSASNFERAQQDLQRGGSPQGIDVADGAAVPEEDVVDPNSWRAKLASSLLVVGAVVILL